MLRGWNSRRHGSSFRYCEFGLAETIHALTNQAPPRGVLATFLGQPDVPLPDLARQWSLSQNNAESSEDRENRLVRIDRPKLAERDSFPNGLRNRKCNGRCKR